MKNLILLGSSRSIGNSYDISQALLQFIEADVVDLKTLDIKPFDYDFGNQSDDFLPLMRKISTDYSLIIFISPVYWYSMSGIMKQFFDRISDCLIIEKELGRTLRGKSMAVVACGSDSTYLPHFFKPFEESAAYLGMKYLAGIHTWKEDDRNIQPEIINRLNEFALKLNMPNSEL